MELIAAATLRASEKNQNALTALNNAVGSSVLRDSVMIAAVTADIIVDTAATLFAVSLSRFWVVRTFVISLLLIRVHIQR